MGNALSRTDSGFGPLLAGKDDFTLLFEDSVLTMAPSIIAILVALIQFFRKFRLPRLMDGGLLLAAKTALGGSLLGLQIAVLALWVLLPEVRTKVTLPAAGLSVASSVCVFLLLFVEHFYSLRPSTFLSLFFSVTLLLDMAKTYSCFNRVGLAPLFIVYIFSCVVRSFLIASQEFSKRHLLRAALRADSKYTNLRGEATGGFWNRALFVWINPTLRIGFRRLLKVEDLQPLSPHSRAAWVAESFKFHWTKADKDSKIALIKACLFAQAGSFAEIAIPRFCQSAFTFAQPFLVLRTVKAVADQGLMNSTAGGLLGATVLIYFGIAVTKAHSKHLAYQVTIRLQSMLVGAIYEKMFSLSYQVLAESNAVTLMSTDLNGLQRIVPLFHDLWASLAELAAGLAILGHFYGGACFLLLIPGLITMICSAVITKKMAVARTAWNESIAKRITRTSNLLAQLKVVKMTGTADAMMDILKRLQLGEIHKSMSERTLRISVAALGAFCFSTAPVLVLAGILFWTRAGEGLNPSELYTILTVVTIGMAPLDTVFFALPALSSATASFPRIQKYLCHDEQVDGRSKKATYNSTKATNISANSEASARIFSDLNIDLEPGKVTILCGPVGCGKTALLKALLGEIPLQAGFIEAPLTALGYADQVAWLRNVSIRDNICQEGFDFDETWYRQVLAGCALDQDVASLPEGDRTAVGSSATNISGGQKQRLALARAVYSRASLLVLDDPFSAVDRTTTSAILERLFGENGIVRASKTTVIMTTSSRDNCSVADAILSMDSDGKITKLPGLSANETENNSFTQLAKELQDDSGNEKSSSIVTSIPKPSTALVPTVEAVDETENEAMRKGDHTLYFHYLGSASALLTVIVVLAITVTALAERMPLIFLRIWQEKDPKNNLYFIGYVLLSVAFIFLSTMSIGIFFRRLVPGTATTMHRRLLDTVMGANLSFLSETDGGSILNRFSHDLSLIGQDLPIDFSNTVFMLNTLWIDMAIICAGGQYVSAIIPVLAASLFFVQYFYLRTSRQLRVRELEAKAPLFTIFTETANGIQHIRAFNWQEAFRSRMQTLLDYSQVPFYSFLCVQRWLTLVMDLIVCAVAAILVGLAVFQAGGTSQNAVGLAMVSLVTFSVTMSFFVESCVDLEISLGAVARIRSFCQLSPQEVSPQDDDENVDETVAAGWLSSGSIEFRGVSASYSKLGGSTHQVLNDVSFSVDHGQNLGLSGRTGSGKSSILAVLLRLIDYSGSILVGGKELRTIPRKVLRSRIITLTQDPLQIQGTIRLNLDPYHPPDNDDEDEKRPSDETLIAALTKVGLWEVVNSCGGLDTPMTDVNLSQGQIQLLAIARAVVRKEDVASKLVFVDEATSSIDHDKDRELQTIMTETFADCTVVMISHRAHAFDKMHKVIRLSEGRIQDISERNASGELVVVERQSL